MRCQRVKISISVWSIMCPMCSEPVTFGGGITIENTGPGAFGSARKSCSRTQNSAQRGSICCGSYVLAISRAIRVPAPERSLHCQRAHEHACNYTNLGLYEAQSSAVNSQQRQVLGQPGKTIWDPFRNLPVPNQRTY